MDHEKEARWQLLDSLLSQGKPLSQDQIFRAYERAGIKKKTSTGYLPSFRKDIDHFKKVLRDADKEEMLVVGRGAYSKVNKPGQDCRTRTYYYRDKGFTLRHLLFSDEMTDAEYLLLVNAIDKLSDMLSPNVFEELRFVIQSRVEADYEKGAVCVEYEDNRRLTGREYRPLFYQAIKNKQILHVHYKNYKGAASDFDFHPYLLKQYNERWFVFGLRPDKNNPYTNIPLDRISQVPRMVGTYPEERPANYSDYFNNIVGVTKRQGATNDDVRHIVIRITDIDAWGRVTTKPLPTQRIVEDFNKKSGYGRICVDVVPNMELYTRILSWGDHVEVEPTAGDQEPRQVMKRLLAQMLQRYR